MKNEITWKIIENFDTLPHTETSIVEFFRIGKLYCNAIAKDDFIVFLKAIISESAQRLGIEEEEFELIFKEKNKSAYSFLDYAYNKHFFITAHHKIYSDITSKFYAPIEMTEYTTNPIKEREREKNELIYKIRALPWKTIDYDKQSDKIVASLEQKPILKIRRDDISNWAYNIFIDIAHKVSSILPGTYDIVLEVLKNDNKPFFSMLEYYDLHSVSLDHQINVDFAKSLANTLKVIDVERITKASAEELYKDYINLSEEDKEKMKLLIKNGEENPD